MEWLNYHHLLYFWTVARSGSLAAASRELRLAPPTVSVQVRALEDLVGEPLFSRSGRKRVLTNAGRLVFRYADEIFGLGHELMGVLRGRTTGQVLHLNVGISDVLPKLVSKRLLEPALRLDLPVRLVCREDKTERLLAELAIRGLDLVLADRPIAGEAKVRAFNHPLGESDMSFFGTSELAAKYSAGFPASLDGAPLLVPTEGTQLRRALDRWFDMLGIHPRIVAEFDDSAMMKVFGQDGEGVFMGASVVEAEIARGYGVSVVGRTKDVRERFYAISVERRIKHPAVVAISEAARALFVRRDDT